MHTIALISQKGGAGKTTLALNLAAAGELDGLATAVLDTDPQQSATGWADNREPETPEVVPAHAKRLDKYLAMAREAGAGLVIIDTAPHSQADSLAAAKAADFILLPCRAAILDLRAMESSIEIARLAGTPAAAVLNAVPPQGPLGREAAEAVAAYGIDVAPAQLCQRVAYMHSLTAGQSVLEYEPAGKAAQEIKALYAWVRQRVNMSTRQHVNRSNRRASA